MRHFFLAVVMVVMAALGARAFTVDGVTYSTSDGVATVTGASSKSITRLTIPAAVTYGGTTYPVNFIAGNAFWGYSSLRELIIEDSDVYIGSTLLVNSDGHNQFGDPFNGCPIKKAYVGRNLANKLGSSNYQADITHITSSVPFDLTIAGKSTFILAGMTNGLTFRNSPVVTTLTVGGAVESIESNAFNGCTNLRKVTILPGETPIKFAENNIFTGCPIDSLIVGRDISSSRCGGAQMHTVIISADVNNLSNSIFDGCTSVKHVVLNDSKETLATSEAYNHMFRGCVLDSVYIGRPYTVSPMFGEAQVKKVIYGPMMDKIEKSSFLSHKELEEVVFSDNITEIGEMAFDGCSSLTEVRLPESLKTIGYGAFDGCKSLVKADLTPNIETIGSSAFRSTALKSVYIPKSVKAIDGSAFESLNLKSFVLEDGDTEIEPCFSYTWPVCRRGSIDSVYVGRLIKNTGTGSPLTRFFESSSVPIKKIEFGPAYAKIPESMCSVYEALESVVLPELCAEIGDRAFSDCTSLEEIKFPESLKTIGSGAFDGCKSLVKADLTPNIETIGSSAFRSTALKSVYIPKSVKAIDGSAFESLNLKSFVLEDGDTEIEPCFSYTWPVCRRGSIDSVYVGRLIKNTGTGSPLTRFFESSSVPIKKIEFGPAYAKIPESMCSVYEALESVVLPELCAEIGDRAFSDCTSLEEIKFPESLKTIGSGAFDGCKSLVKADLTPNIETIGSAAFRSTALKSVYIPKSVKAIDGNAFESLNLKSFILEDGDTEIEPCFSDTWPICRNGSIDSVYIGRLIENTASGSLARFFEKNSVSIKKIEFGSVYTEIPGSACSSYRALEYVGLPATLEKLGSRVFSGCGNIDSIHIAAKIPPVCESTSQFDSQVYTNATLTVPVGSKKAYRAAEVWKLFRNIQSEGGGFKVSVSADTAYGEVLLNGSSASEITVDEDESLTVAISPVEGYSISNVTVNGTDVTASLVDGTLEYESLDSNMEIEVTFSIITFTLSVPAELTGGHILVNGLDAVPATVDYGSRLEISAVPDRGYLLVSMTVGGVDVTASLDESLAYVIDRVTADVVVDAVFEPIVYTVTAVAPTDFGTLTLNGATGDCRVAFGQPLVIGVTPAHEGCYLASLTVDGTDVTASVKDGVYTVESVEADMTVEAVFGINTYTVELVCDPERGAIIPDLPGSDVGVTVTHGATLNLAITPAEGFEIESVLLDGTDVTSHLRGNSVLTLEYVKGPHRVEAVFAVRRVRLSVLGLEGGQLSMRYDYGSPVTMLVEPADGWMFHSLTLGDEVVTVLDDDDSYTIPSLTDDTTVSVVFKLDQGSAGVDELTRRITVSARQRTVTITGASEGEAVEIYDTSGMRVYRGTDHVIDLNRQGVFIVRVASLSFKVMLK